MSSIKISLIAALCALFAALPTTHAQTIPLPSISAPVHASPDPADPALTAPPLTPPPLTLTPQYTPNDPSTLSACACGCGVFAVGTSSMLPQGPGGTLWFEYDYLAQTHNWRGDSHAPAANNDDKLLRTDFFQVGLQYLFNRSWGLQIEVPVDHRTFKTDDGGSLSSTSWCDMGDVRIKGLYTGFSPDLSLGLDFGVKLPTGDFTHKGADSDSQIGSGSTDFLLGGFYRFNFPDPRWTAFFQAETDLPILTQNAYRPGFQFDGAAGIYYSGFSFQQVNLIPIAQIIASERTSDSGANASHPTASGYQRLMLSPGLELQFDRFSIYGDVEFPVFQHMTGDQLVAPALFKVIISYSF